MQKIIKMDKIIGIGNALVDVLVRLEDERTLADLSLPKGGMVLIDDEQQRVLSERIKTLNPAKATGGSAGNAMLALANLGAEPGFIGRVADDDMGRFFRQNCKDCGIEARLLTADGHSGVANTFITPDAERTFATYLGVAAGLSADDIKPELFSGYQLLHIEGYLVQDNALIETICRTAKEMGLLTSIDLASYNVVKDNHAVLRNLVEKYIDIVFANEEESAAFTGKEPEESLREIASMADVAVVKLGKRGALAMQNGKVARVAGRSQKVVDTTAAGDFFAGGFLYAFTHGASMERCLEMGSLLAGNIIQIVGTRLPESTWENILREAANVIKG